MDKKSQGLSAFIVPIAIVLAGVIVSGSIFASQNFANRETDDTTDTSTELVKNDKPVVELFIMSHCPYGTMAEKGIIPVVEALGDKIDFKLRFVYYAMHGEKEAYEQLNQYCIQEYQSDKFLPYLKEFLKDGDSERALEATNINIENLNECIASADEEFGVTKYLEDESTYLSGSYPLFYIDYDLNAKYEVQGSPTLIINGTEVSSARDSASYLKTICSAFNDAPEECNVELSTDTPSTGFGYETTENNDASEAQCS